MVVNHLQKLFVTSDAAAIIKELDIMHPAAKIAVLASQMQEQEVSEFILFRVNSIGIYLLYKDWGWNKLCPRILWRIASECRIITPTRSSH